MAVEFTKSFGPKEHEVLLEINLQKESYKKAVNKQQLFISLVGALALLLGILLSETILLGIGTELLIVGILLVKPLNKFRLKRAYKNIDERAISGTRTYKVSDSGIEVSSFAGTSHNNWDAMESYGVIDEYVWITRLDRQIILFDKELLSEEQTTELMTLLSKNIKKAQ